jgi:predicted RNA-binding protein
MSERTTSFSPLPGGYKNYLETLQKFLSKISEEPTFEELVSWASKTFNKSPEWMNSCIRDVIIYPGLASLEGKNIRLTDKGLEFLKSNDPEVVLRTFLENVWGIREIIIWLYQEGPLSRKQIFEKCVDLDVRWQRDYQVGYRLRWLNALGCIEKKIGKYTLTSYGVRIAEELLKSKLLPESPKGVIPTITKTSEHIQAKPPKEESIHNKIRDMIYEIGKFMGMISETEYPIDKMRLDVVWKKIKDGNPSHVFEVQIGGNFFEALTKLKHAWDKWNSKPFLITTEKYEIKAKQLLEGSFHEIEQITKIVHWEKIKELYDAEKRVKDLKNEIGII